MNESFADLTIFEGLELEEDPTPFLHSMTENTIKGYAYSSVFGGTTANSEYEFLTGNTTAFLPAGTVPYQMYVSSGDPTLVGQMAALGYQWDTQAVPPCGEPSDSQEGTEEVPGTSSASSDGAE